MPLLCWTVPLQLAVADDATVVLYFNKTLDIAHNTVEKAKSNQPNQGSFPAGTPGNGVPKVILTVGTAFPGTQYSVSHLLHVCEHAARLNSQFAMLSIKSKLSNSAKSGQFTHGHRALSLLHMAGVQIANVWHFDLPLLHHLN